VPSSCLRQCAVWNLNAGTSCGLCSDKSPVTRRDPSAELLEKNGVIIRFPKCFSDKKLRFFNKDCKLIPSPVALPVQGWRHWVSFVIGPGQGIIVDADHSNPEPVPFRAAGLEAMGYTSLFNILQLFLTGKGQAKVAKLRPLEKATRSSKTCWTRVQRISHSQPDPDTILRHVHVDTRLGQIHAKTVALTSIQQRRAKPRAKRLRRARTTGRTAATTSNPASPHASA
jgi:hypothetical protein